MTSAPAFCSATTPSSTALRKSSGSTDRIASTVPVCQTTKAGFLPSINLTRPAATSSAVFLVCSSTAYVNRERRQFLFQHRLQAGWIGARPPTRGWSRTGCLSPEYPADGRFSRHPRPWEACFRLSAGRPGPHSGAPYPRQTAARRPKRPASDINPTMVHEPDLIDSPLPYRHCRWCSCSARHSCRRSICTMKTARPRRT